ncbi:MAG: hypothetical protein WCU00_03295 [Candidatus Latescibacterota bacterium]
MPDNLSSETSEKIRALCRKISVANNIDEEIQEELYSHMEDKFLGYLSGEEKITEDDAFILVREHFGDPEHIRFLMKEVHKVDTQISFFRKLGAIYIATSAVDLFSGYINKLFQLALVWMFNVQHIRDTIGSFYCASVFLSAIIFISILGFIVHRWKMNSEKGIRNWFDVLNPFIFIGLVLFFIISPAINSIFWSGRGIAAPIFDLLLKSGVGFSKSGPNYFVENLMQVQAYISGFFSEALICMIWLWWFDRPVKRNLSILIGFMSWLFFSDPIGYFLQDIRRIFFFIYQHEGFQGIATQIDKLNIFNPLNFIHHFIWFSIGLISVLFYMLIVMIHERLNKQPKPELIS